ncbi:MAG: hypothetical protein RH917_05080 [Lacipirellulaceae bacterium]
MTSKTPCKFLLLSFACLSVNLICPAAFQIAAHAHNGAILVQEDAGKLVTGLDSVITGQQTMGNRAFSLQFPSPSPQFPSSVGNDVPAFSSLGNAPAGTETLPLGGELYWDFLPMTHAGITANLLYWDGLGTTIQDVDFGAVPESDTKLTLYTEGFFDNAFVDGSPEFVPGEHIGTVTNNMTQPLHAHRWFFLDAPSAPTLTEGVYLFAMQLRMEGFETTDPFFIAAGTDNISFNTLDQLVIPWVEDHLDTLVTQDMSGSGDVDTDGDYDGADFLAWQRGVGMPESLADWNLNYGNDVSNARLDVQAIPEPRSLLLVGLISFRLACRKARLEKTKRY